jgi:hypothetical protein
MEGMEKLMSDSRGRADQDLQTRRQILQRRHVIALPRSTETTQCFWTVFSRAYAEAYGREPEDVTFEHTDETLASYPPATAGTCVLFSGGVESTYIALLHRDAARFTIDTEADVHPRGGEMFIEARNHGFGELLYGGNERDWGERDGRLWDHRTGKWILSETFEFTESFRELWRQYLGVRIQCPTEDLYKDEIVQRIYDLSQEAYGSLQSCCFLRRGWCGYCDKCLMTGAIVEALGLPPLFRMTPSPYSVAIKEELRTYRVGDYDPFGRLPLFRRLQDIFGYSLTI